MSYYSTKHFISELFLIWYIFESFYKNLISAYQSANIKGLEYHFDFSVFSEQDKITKMQIIVDSIRIFSSFLYWKY
jgi:hypothetical protein